jgi:asparagine synthetase B (glutamine-hydrolysing)
MIPTFLVCQEVSKHCKVVLGGDGGDELFGGYHHYQKLIISKYININYSQTWIQSCNKEAKEKIY